MHNLPNAAVGPLELVLFSDVPRSKLVPDTTYPQEIVFLVSSDKLRDVTLNSAVAATCRVQ